MLTRESRFELQNSYRFRSPQESPRCVLTTKSVKNQPNIVLNKFSDIKKSQINIKQSSSICDISSQISSSSNLNELKIQKVESRMTIQDKMHIQKIFNIQKQKFKEKMLQNRQKRQNNEIINNNIISNSNIRSYSLHYEFKYTSTLTCLIDISHIPIDLYDNKKIRRKSCYCKQCGIQTNKQRKADFYVPIQQVVKKAQKGIAQMGKIKALNLLVGAGKKQKNSTQQTNIQRSNSFLKNNDKETQKEIGRKISSVLNDKSANNKNQPRKDKDVQVSLLKFLQEQIEDKSSEGEQKIMNRKVSNDYFPSKWRKNFYNQEKSIKFQQLQRDKSRDKPMQNFIDSQMSQKDLKYKKSVESKLQQILCRQRKSKQNLNFIITKRSTSNQDLLNNTVFNNKYHNYDKDYLTGFKTQRSILRIQDESSRGTSKNSSREKHNISSIRKSEQMIDNQANNANNQSIRIKKKLYKQFQIKQNHYML